MLEYLKYGFLPRVLHLGFTATLSATGSGDLQPCRPGGVAGADGPGLVVLGQGPWLNSVMVATDT